MICISTLGVNTFIMLLTAFETTQIYGPELMAVTRPLAGCHSHKSAGRKASMFHHQARTGPALLNGDKFLYREEELVCTVGISVECSGHQLL